VVLWSFGVGGGGCIDSCEAYVWTCNTRLTRGKGNDALVIKIWTGRGGGGIGHWLVPEEGLVGKLSHPSILGYKGDSRMFTILGWGCKITLGAAWGCGKDY